MKYVKIISKFKTKNKKVKIKIPSFTIDTKLLIMDNSDSKFIDQDIRIELESTQSMGVVLDKVVTKAVAKAVNNLGILKKPLSKKDVYIGGHASIFPNYIFYNYDKK